MLFNSLEFFVFLTVVYALYLALSHRRQNLMLLVASYLFYGWWDVRFLYLLLVSTVIDFACGLLIDRGRLSRGERLRSALFGLLGAFFFVTVQWEAVSFRAGLFPVIDWGRVLPGSLEGWAVFLGTLAVLLVAQPLIGAVSRLPEERRRRTVIWVTMCSNLGILGFFKYYGFFVSSAEEALRALGVQVEMLHLHIVLPVGISFYTFQTMSYTIDVYRRHMPATDRLLDFALFVAYFPQLVAGPIERAAALLPALLAPRVVTVDQVCRGSFLILFGLFKKVAIADGVASKVNSIYNSSGAVSWGDIVVATFLFAIQIYGDFSGYSDIARGVSKWMGIDLMINFDQPYFSKNPSEFWRRWHISLSSWLRDYLYITLGGNRHGPRKTYRNLMATMVLGGLWHGAAWNFVLWGVYQGGILGIHRWFTGGRGREEAVPGGSVGAAVKGLLLILFFFCVTCYGWLLFRANSLEQVVTFTRTLLVDFGDWRLSIQRPSLAAMLGVPLLLAYEITQHHLNDRHFYRRLPAPARGALYAALLFILSIGLSNEPAQFIYFQF